MNALHLHMYNVGILSLAQILVIYPSLTSAAVTVLAVAAAATKEAPVVINRR